MSGQRDRQVGREMEHYAIRVRRHTRLGGLLNFYERAA
jgi:hypothetical protein